MYAKRRAHKETHKKVTKAKGNENKRLITYLKNILGLLLYNSFKFTSLNYLFENDVLKRK